MKRIIIELFTIISFLALSACSKNTSGQNKIFKEAQNPEIRLSEEHGKMLNLIFNLSEHKYKRWRIDLDTSSDNYYIEYNYTDKEQYHSTIDILHLQYCNGVITDRNLYRYNCSTGETEKLSSTRIRWTESEIDVKSDNDKQYVYLLDKPDELQLVKKPNYLYMAYKIQKMENGDYFYVQFDPDSTASDYIPDAYIQYISIVDFLDDNQYMFISEKDSEVPQIVYKNGRLIYNLDYACAYKFDDETETTGTYTYTDATTLAMFRTPDSDKVEIYPITRYYDDDGNLLYEKRMSDDGSGSYTLMMFRKSLPDVKEFSESYETPIDLVNAKPRE